MEKEFIPYEQALALKELGFDEETFGFYWSDTTQLVYDNAIGRHHGCHRQAPLYQQAFRWFREKYNIQLGICHIHGGFDCWTNDGDLFENGKYCNFKTYEEAELECLKKLIEIVKINKNKKV
jgi:hypothetical protein